MNSRKKIISIVIKILVGLASLLVIYIRLHSDFTEANLHLLSASIFSPEGIACFLVCVLLIPVNLGIESYKWKTITAPVEQINMLNAQRSVYSGVCLGNLAPGRATEFLAKIIFFKPENRPKVTVLHFVGGMFQLSITYIAGFLALTCKLGSIDTNSSWILYLVVSCAVIVTIVFVVCLVKIDRVLNFVSKKISKQQSAEHFHYSFTASVLLKLFGGSLLRYLVFSGQMALLIYLFSGSFDAQVLIGIALYFLITTTLPMISVLEAAIRTAIALVVFKDCSIPGTALALASVMTWLLNIVVPSIVGYFVLLKQNFDFKIYRLQK